MTARIYAASGFNITGLLRGAADWPTDAPFPWTLESYHYIHKKDGFIRDLQDAKQTIFLDSGAFTMFTQGKEIDLELYSRFVKENASVLHVSSNVDVIGAGEEQRTYDNQKRLEDMGARIQPVFHARDRDEWLVRYLDEGYDYIFLGGMVPESSAYLEVWLDRIWAEYLTNKDGTARVKVHGFGLTSVPLMLRYPWFSCDSTSWINGSKFGQIFYTDDAGDELRLLIGSSSPYRRQLDKHFDSLAEPMQARVREQVGAKGFDVDELRSDYRKRWFYNLLYYSDLERKIPDRFTRRQNTLGLY